MFVHFLFVTDEY